MMEKTSIRCCNHYAARRIRWDNYLIPSRNGKGRKDPILVKDLVEQEPITAIKGCFLEGMKWHSSLSFPLTGPTKSTQIGCALPKNWVRLGHPTFRYKQALQTWGGEKKWLFLWTRLWDSRWTFAFIFCSLPGSTTRGAGTENRRSALVSCGGKPYKRNRT